jgi:hypothetical protein
VEVGHRLLAVLAPDVGGDVVHRARAVERDHGGEVVDGGRREVADVAAHAGDSSWKTPVVSPDASSSKVVASSSGIVSRSMLDAAVVADEVDRLAQDRQVRQARGSRT